jgi:hypothetical protein
MAQSTTNLGKIHVFPSEALYNQFKDIIADNDLALLKDDGAYIVAALLKQNGYVKFSNGLILQWGVTGNNNVSFPVTFSQSCYIVNCNGSSWGSSGGATSAGISIRNITLESFVISTWEQSPYRWFALGM